MAKLFFSYSHKDENFRDELEVHLAQLKRQNIIEAWHDKMIDAGNDLDKSISQELEDSDIILLLVSPYFLASGYCYDIELQRALERHNAGEAQIIPVIVNPCEWLESPLKKLKAVPKDGKPISKYPNQHDAFLEITTAIRKIAEKITSIETNQNTQIKTSIPPAYSQTSPSPLPRSSNLRIKKTFTQQEKDDFLESSFEYMCNYFEGSLDELEKRTPEITTKFRKIDANNFTATIYSNGQTSSQCKINFGNGSFLGSGIYYSSNISSNDNSFNNSISVEDDGYILYLKAMMGFSGIGMSATSREDSKLTQEGASEYFWETLIKPLQY